VVSLTACSCEPRRSTPEDAHATSPVEAVITAVRPGLESVPSVVVEVRFSNAANHPMTVDAYEITWPDGRFAASDVSLALAPGQIATRTARLDGSSPDRLTTRSATARVLEAHEGPPP
jgi:hypothetical protein